MEKQVTTAEVDNRQVTIKMPKELLDKWLEALRSGKYPQGRRFLKKGGAYCCLGVLQMTVDGKCERYPDDTHGYRALPSQEWLARNGVKFSGWGDCGQIPFLPTLSCSATDANDVKEKSFAEIADAIEACAVGV